MNKVIATSLYAALYSSSIDAAARSPAYEAVRSFTISSLQVGKVFDYWAAIGVDEWNNDPREATCRWVVENVDIFKSFVPRGYPRILLDDNSPLKVRLYVISLILASAALAMTMMTIVVTFRQRKRRVMKMAQLGFVCLLLSGITMVSCSSLFMALNPTDASCVVSIWLINIGYTLELVPLIIKVAAINRLIQAGKKLKRVVLRREALFGGVFVVCILVASFLTLWTVIDPPEKVKEYDLTTSQTETGETIVTLDYSCQSKTQLWIYLSIGWHAVLLLGATAIAFQTRNHRHCINESQTLAILIYSHFFFITLRILTIILEPMLGSANGTKFWSIILSCDTIAVVCIYFVPKFLVKELAEPS